MKWSVGLGVMWSGGEVRGVLDHHVLYNFSDYFFISVLFSLLIHCCFSIISSIHHLIINFFTIFYEFITLSFILLPFFYHFALKIIVLFIIYKKKKTIHKIIEIKFLLNFIKESFFIFFFFCSSFFLMKLKWISLEKKYRSFMATKKETTTNNE